MSSPVPGRPELLMPLAAPSLPLPGCRQRSGAHLVVNRLPVLPQRSPAAHAGRLLVQVDSDVLLQLLVDLLESSHLLDVLHQAAIQAFVGETPALIQPRGQGHGGGGAAETLEEDAADAQGSTGHSGAQAAHAAGGNGAHVDAGGSRQAHSASDAHPAAGRPRALRRGGGGLLPQEGGPAPRQGHVVAPACRAPPLSPAASPRTGGTDVPSPAGWDPQGISALCDGFLERGALCCLGAPVTLSGRLLGQQSHCRGNLPAAAAANVADEKHNGVYGDSGTGIQYNVRVKIPAVFSTLTPRWSPTLIDTGIQLYITNVSASHTGACSRHSLF